MVYIIIDIYVKDIEMFDWSRGFTKFENKVWLSSPTMHGDELKYIKEAYDTNWMSTVGENINEIEKEVASKIGMKYAIALSSGTAALHLAVRMAGEKLYGKPKGGGPSLSGRKVFCSDLTFAATVNPVVYEGGEPVFIDTEYDTWNMCPKALERAFEIYPDVRLIVVANLYGTPAKMRKIREIANSHNAIIIEDAAESFGAFYEGRPTGNGMYSDYACISFNGNKIITGSSGGMLLTNNFDDAEIIRKWSTQSRDSASWYQHSELGFNYRMSNVIAGGVRGQLPYLKEHVARKKAIYEGYEKGLQDLPVSMNPYDKGNSNPNFWLSCLIIDKNHMCRQLRDDKESLYISSHNQSCPTEILAALASINAEGRPVWKPMHMQPVYAHNPFVTREGMATSKGLPVDVGRDIFDRGVCLPSDIKMTPKQQEKIIDVIRCCFQ